MWQRLASLPLLMVVCRELSESTLLRICSFSQWIFSAFRTRLQAIGHQNELQHDATAAISAIRKPNTGLLEYVPATCHPRSFANCNISSTVDNSNVAKLADKTGDVHVSVCKDGQYLSSIRLLSGNRKGETDCEFEIDCQPLTYHYCVSTVYLLAPTIRHTGAFLVLLLVQQLLE